jgi:hypothetical protein
MSEAEVEREWSTRGKRLADAIFIGLPALLLHATAAGRAVPVVWPIALPYFLIADLWSQPYSLGPLVERFDPAEREPLVALNAARAAGWGLAQTVASRTWSHIVTVSRGGRIVARPFAAHVTGNGPILPEAIPRLPLFPYLPPRLRSLPRDWWNAPDLAWKLSLVAALELVFNVVLIDAGQFDGVLILRDLLAMAGLVGFAQFYYYARVDMVLRKLEREQAAEEARAKPEGRG